MSVSVSIVEKEESLDRHLCTERQFREFRRWAREYGDYPILNSIPLLDDTDGEYRATFSYDDETEGDLYSFLKEIVDLANKTVYVPTVPEIFDHILYTLIDMATEALKEGLTLALS